MLSVEEARHCQPEVGRLAIRMGDHGPLNVRNAVHPVFGDRQRVAGGELDIPFPGVIAGLFTLLICSGPYSGYAPGGIRIASWVKGLALRHRITRVDGT